MEVEFLSNVRYNLFASNDEWSEWHAKLKRFSDFYHKTSLIPEDNEQFVSKAPALHISPDIAPPSLSPASKLPPMDKSLRILPSWSPSVNNGALYTPLLPRLGNEITPSGNSRKRGRDELTDERPVKRRATCNPIIAKFQPSFTQYANASVSVDADTDVCPVFPCTTHREKCVSYVPTTHPPAVT